MVSTSPVLEALKKYPEAYRAVKSAKKANGFKNKNGHAMLGSFLTREQMATELGIRLRKLDYLRHDGMPYFKHGKLILFDKEEVRKWMVTTQPGLGGCGCVSA